MVQVRRPGETDGRSWRCTSGELPPDGAGACMLAGSYGREKVCH